MEGWCEHCMMLRKMEKKGNRWETHCGCLLTAKIVDDIRKVGCPKCQKLYEWEVVNVSEIVSTTDGRALVATCPKHPDLILVRTRR